MKLLRFHPLGDSRFPAKAESLRRQGPVGEIGIIEGLHRLNPAHPFRHRFKVTPDGPDAVYRCFDLRCHRMFKPTSHQATAAFVASCTGRLRISAAARWPLIVAPSMESM